jgi:nucleoside phosphorylase
VRTGPSWTTDAPFRETAEAIEAARQKDILAVEMEAAALYAFAAARKKPVLCIAHVTNQMGQIEGDFEKGLADGAEESLRLISLVARRWLDSEASRGRLSHHARAKIHTANRFPLGFSASELR